MTRGHHTKAQQLHMDKTAALGCICCRMDRRGFVPANLHHIRAAYGASQLASHFEVLPLCEGHHQGKLLPKDKTKIAFHENREAWERRYGLERDVLALIHSFIVRMDAQAPDWWQFADQVLSGEEIA